MELFDLEVPVKARYDELLDFFLTFNAKIKLSSSPWEMVPSVVASVSTTLANKTISSLL